MTGGIGFTGGVFPVGDAAAVITGADRSEFGFAVVGPALHAGCRVQRDDPVKRRAEYQRAARSLWRQQRCRMEACEGTSISMTFEFPGLVAPGLLQPADIVPVDSGQIRMVRAAGAAAVLQPVLGVAGATENQQYSEQKRC